MENEIWKAIYYIYFPQDVLLLFVKYIVFIFAITFTINPCTAIQGAMCIFDKFDHIITFVLFKNFDFFVFLNNSQVRIFLNTFLTMNWFF